jgi:hypothetical protein
MTQCSAGQACCKGTCTDVKSNPFNCGTCGNIVRYTCQVCVISHWHRTLQCPAGETCCNGVCVSLQSSPSNCGGCSITVRYALFFLRAGLLTIGMIWQCAAGQACCKGACSSLNVDSSNCGKCSNAVSSAWHYDSMRVTIDRSIPQCPTGSTCQNGACICTATGKPSCNGQCVRRRQVTYKMTTTERFWIVCLRLYMLQRSLHRPQCQLKQLRQLREYSELRLTFTFLYR